MEKDIKKKIRMLETKKMSAQVNAERQEKAFSFYPRIPLYLFLLIVFIFFSWGINDALTHETTEIIDGQTFIFYGIWQLGTKFHVYVTWTLIGVVIGLLVFLITKAIISSRILIIEHLKIATINNQLQEMKEVAKKLPPNPDN